MKLEEVLEKIKSEKQRVVYLSGKTCTGKTTFSNLLEGSGYTRVELDRIVTESVVEKYNVVPNDAFLTAYRGEGPSKHIEAFIAAAKKVIIEKSAENSIVVEGAIAKASILQDVFSGINENLFFVYFHPRSIDVYVDRIMERFLSGAHTNTTGLPKRFWSLVDMRDVEFFLETGGIPTALQNAMREFAESSAEESEKRLRHLEESFPDIHTVEF